ncbi:MAG: HAMP domain-containing sensor histidine kinase [Thermoleophilia bacterium]
MTTAPGIHGSERDVARERQSYVRHELRGPLAVMYPALSMLLDGNAGELTTTQREYLEMLQRNVVRLEGMLGSAVDSGWIDCAAAPYEPAAASLGDVVAAALESRRLRRLPGPPIELDDGSRAAPAVWADRDHVQQVVANLLDNAAHFTPAQGAVTVRAGAGAALRTVTLVVSDTGCGIPSDELAHVFEFGFRGAAAAEVGVPGVGLGLWTCRYLVERNGGTIALESSPGAGTTVTVTLPAPPAPT